MDILLSALTGGVIGYFTNWLAIKMLFRPLEEKRILGIKIPFTPGLIPKEKNRIAKNIGITVEEYLLSPQVIVKSFKEKNGKLQVKKFIDSKIEDLKDRDLNLKDLFLEIPEIKRSIIVNKIMENGSDSILEGIKSLNISKGIVDVLNREIANEKNIANINSVLFKEYRRLINSEDMKSNLEDKINMILSKMEDDDRLIREVFSESLVDDINKYIDENHKVLSYKIRTVVKEDNVKDRIKTTIRNLVQANVSGLAAAFIPMDVVSEKGYEAIENYVESNDAGEDLNNVLKIIINNILNSKIKDASKNLVDTVDRKIIVRYIINILNGDNIENQIQKSISEAIENVDMEKIEEFMSKELNSLLSKESTKEFISEVLKALVGKIGEIKINDVLNNLYIDSELIYYIIERIFTKLLKGDINDVIKDFNISGIVEETILSFENEFTEKLILDIASKELRAITILGGVLGMFIGVLNPLLQNLMK